jgi:hypothetical protein
MKKPYILLVIIIFIVSCSQKIYLKKIKGYFNASTIDEKARFMADNYHSHFMEAKGKGEDKNAALQSFQNWDAPLHPQIDISSYTVNKNRWTIQFNEQNDFSKLIDFPRMESYRTDHIQFSKIN